MHRHNPASRHYLTATLVDVRAARPRRTVKYQGAEELEGRVLRMFICMVRELAYLKLAYVHVLKGSRFNS